MKKSIHLLMARYTLTLTLALSSYFVFAQWVRKADALKARSDLKETVVYNSKLYSFCGFSDPTRVADSTSEVYDPATNTWKYIARMRLNTAVTHENVILIDNTIWLIGGRLGKNPGPLTSSIYIYNIATDTWSKGPDVRDPATGQPMVIGAWGGVLLGRVLHLFGGFTPTACNNDQDKYHLTLNVDSWLSNPSEPARWENTLRPLPMKRNHFSSLVLGGKIYAIGGQIDHDCGGAIEVPYCHVYNPTTDLWTQLPSLPTGRSHAEGSTFAIDGKIYMVGGQGSDGKSSRYVTIFDPAANNGTGAWAENSSLTLPFIYEGCSATVIGTTFILSHGSQGTSKYPLKMTFTRTIARNPVYKLGFPSECLNLSDSPNGSLKGHTWLYTIDGAKSYTASSSASWLTVSKNAAGIANPNAVDIEVTANTSGLSAGTYNATVTATGTGGGTNYTGATLCVKLTVQQGGGPLKYNLSVTSNGNGSVDKTPDQVSYSDGASVILTAKPSPGQQFTGWSGSASGTANPLNITMNSDKTITANFQSQILITNLVVSSKKSYVIAQLKTNITHYTDRTYRVTSVPDIINMAPFIRTPNDDRSSKVSSIIQFNLTQRAVIYIAYDPRATALPAWLNGWQKSGFLLGVTDAAINHLNLYSKVYQAGKIIIGGNMENPAAGAQSNYIVIAVAQPVQYNLTVTNSVNGMVTKSPDQNVYNAGTIITLTATPVAGQQFTGWRGSATGSTNPLSVTMDADKTISASFSAVQYGLTVNTNGNGSVSKAPDQDSYNSGSTVTLNATPGDGYQFTGWSGSATGSTNPLSVTMDADKTISASFSAVQYGLTVNTMGIGSVSKTPDQDTYNSGSTVTLTATPGDGYQFTGWSGSATGNTNPLDITIDAAKTITANFSAVQYGLTVNINGNGSVSKTPDQDTYNSGSTVILTATPDDGRQFTGWSDDGSGTDNPLTIIIDANKTVTATFESTAQGRAGADKISNVENKTAAFLTGKQYSGCVIKIYPNPFSGSRLKMEIFGLPKNQKINIVISNVFGNIYQTIAETTDQAGALNKIITFDKVLSRGIYVLKINSPMVNKVLKIIVR